MLTKQEWEAFVIGWLAAYGINRFWGHEKLAAERLVRRGRIQSQVTCHRGYIRVKIYALRYGISEAERAAYNAAREKLEQQREEKGK